MSFWERLLSVIGSNLGTKMVSLFIAVVLWSVVLGSRTVEVTKEIPLEILTSSDVIPSNDLPEKVSFRLAGPKAFLRAILDRREDPIRINLVGNSPGLVTHRFYSDHIRVPIGVKVVSVNPSVMLIRLEAVKRKEVPVRVEIRGAPPPGFRMGEVKVVPPTIRVRGPESKIAGLERITTLPIDVSALVEPLDVEASVDLARFGVQADQPMPRVQVGVETETTSVRLRNVLVRASGGGSWSFLPSSVTVLARGPAPLVSKLDRDQVRVIAQTDPRPALGSEVAVKVLLPDGFTVIRVLPDRVKAMAR